MPVAGGLLDQPAGVWFAAQRAGYIDYLIGEYKRDGFDLGKCGLSDSQKDEIVRLQTLETELIIKHGKGG